MKTKFNTEFEVKLMDITNLTSDKLYQRPLDMARVERIAKNYLTIAENPPVLNVRANGDIAIVDGQHTVAANLYLEKTEMLCKVLNESLTVNEEAFLFVYLNEEQKQPSNRAKLKARYRAGDPYLVKFNDIVQKYGFTLNWDEDKSNKEVNSIYALIKPYDIYSIEGERHLNNVFKLLKDAWKGRREAALGKYIGGMSVFVKTYKDFVKENYADVKEALYNADMENLMLKCNKTQSDFKNIKYNSRIPTDHYMAYAILSTINKELKKKGKSQLSDQIFTQVNYNG